MKALFFVLAAMIAISPACSKKPGAALHGSWKEIRLLPTPPNQSAQKSPTPRWGNFAGVETIHIYKPDGIFLEYVTVQKKTVAQKGNWEIVESGEGYFKIKKSYITQKQVDVVEINFPEEKKDRFEMTVGDKIRIFERQETEK